jgi:uncharacterized protein (DUF58 family)
VEPIAEKPARRRDRIRPVTFFYIVLSLLVLLGAMSSQNNLLFWLVGAAIGGVAVHGLIAGPAMMGVRLGRVGGSELHEPAAAARLGIELTSVSRFRVARALRVECRLAGPLDERVVLLGGAEALLPGGRVHVWAEGVLPYRGMYDITSIRVSTTYPFGLSRKTLIFRRRYALRCVPRGSGAGASPPARGPGLSPARRVGRRIAESGEPVSLREYRSGDPRRLIAWRASARAGRLMVREHDDTESPTLWIRLRVETNALRRREPSVERAVAEAAQIAERQSSLGRVVIIWHPPSGAVCRSDDPGGWRPGLATLGDLSPARRGSGPVAGDQIIDVGAGATA